MDDRLRRRIYRLMKHNRRAQDGFVYTVPSPDLYPFQWLWDSCFHAVILAHFDEKAAYAELHSVLARPLQNHLLPHIIYWKKDYRITNWGREMRGDIISASWGIEGTSAITQPPLLASVLWDLHKRFKNTAFLKKHYETIRAYYLALLRERDPEARGLFGIINPDESGEDNSPRFDRAQGLSSHHLDRENLDKRIERIQQNRDCDFDARECMRKHFWVEDVSFNAIALRAFEALACIADELNEKTDARGFRNCAEHTKKSMRAEMRYRNDLYYSLECYAHTPIKLKTWNIFMPLYAGILEKEEAKKLIETHLVDPTTFWTPFAIPSVARDEKVYAKENFWRGPSWMAINWFIYKGLVGYGYHDLANALKERSIALVNHSGFREYYDPETGMGLGSKDFTWGGLIIDM